MEKARRRGTRWLVCIGVYHLILLITVGYLLFRINLTDSGLPAFGNGGYTLWANVALLGCIGSLLYFSRKTYVYLIAGKLWKIDEELITELHNLPSSESERLERYRAKLAGYYLYLITRPFGGLAIGPLITMVILGGLTTLTKDGKLNGATLSLAGEYLVYTFAFAGGYASSDFFDYVSTLVGRVLENTTKGESTGS
jgi:hypothetical protein